LGVLEAFSTYNPGLIIIMWWISSWLTSTWYRSIFLSPISNIWSDPWHFYWLFIFQILDTIFHSSHSQNPSVTLLAIAMIIHTIPISLTVGNLLGNAALSITITASIILHHIPEGFALSTALLSQGERLWRLFLYFIVFSIFFSFFILIGQYWDLSEKAQGLLMGISIGLIATTSISEFILHHIRSVTLKSLIIYVCLGYLLSYVFHTLVE